MEDILVTCRCCSKGKLLRVDINKFDKWKSREMLAQNAFPHLTPPDRELIISGTCGKCWEDMFGGGEEEEAG